MARRVAKIGTETPSSVICAIGNAVVGCRHATNCVSSFLTIS
jgi:hypothetical protein